jgi:predicted lactoylglutathione lyase
MIMGEHIYAMLLTEEKFQGFTDKKLCDAKTQVEVITCLALESRQKVDEMVAQAVAAGGYRYNDPQDHGFMYQHGFQDIDGHVWEVMAATVNV